MNIDYHALTLNHGSCNRNGTAGLRENAPNLECWILTSCMPKNCDLRNDITSAGDLPKVLF